jgi:hypothetical protein
MARLFITRQLTCELIPVTAANSKEIEPELLFPHEHATTGLKEKLTVSKPYFRGFG